jgi:hypothetical protein
MHTKTLKSIRVFVRLLYFVKLRTGMKQLNKGYESLSVLLVQFNVSH